MEEQQKERERKNEVIKSRGGREREGEEKSTREQERKKMLGEGGGRLPIIQFYFVIIASKCTVCLFVLFCSKLT